jgi:hypothetical protein
MTKPIAAPISADRPIPTSVPSTNGVPDPAFMALSLSSCFVFF